MIRVYEDGTIAVKHEGKYWQLNPETLKIDAVKPIDDSKSTMESDNPGP